MTVTAGVILLYCVAMVVAIVTQRIRVPYTAALLLVGVGLGALNIVAPPHLTKELLFAIFLPGLLFEAAYHLEVHELRENAWAIEITLTTIAAYGAFVLAEQLHFSGVLATVAAGVVCGHTGRHHVLTAARVRRWMASGSGSRSPSTRVSSCCWAPSCRRARWRGSGGWCCWARSRRWVRAPSWWVS